MKHLVKKVFDERPGSGKIIPFPVWLIPFPVSKINFELIGQNEKHFVKEVF